MLVNELLFEMEMNKLIASERLDELSKAALGWGKKSGQSEEELQRAWDSAEQTVVKSSGKAIDSFTGKEWGLTNNIYMRTVAKYSPGKVTELKKTVSKKWKTNSSKKTLKQRNDEIDAGGVKPEPKKMTKTVKDKLSKLTVSIKETNTLMKDATPAKKKSLKTKVEKLKQEKKDLQSKFA